MKRVISLALAALLLAGCSSAPAASSTTNTAVTAETAAAEASVGNGEPLRLLQHGDEKQFYISEDVDNSETLLRYRIADLTQCTDFIPCDIEGCTHDTENCPAVIKRAFGNRLWVLNDDILLAMQYSYEDFSTTLTLMDRECHDRRVLTTLDGYDLFSSSDHAYTDGDALYCYGNQSNQDGIYRVDLESGSISEVCRFSTYSLPILGVIGRSFVLTQSDLAYPDSSGDLATDALAQPTGTKSHVLLNVDTGEVREFCSYSSDDYVLDRLYFYVIGGQYYWIDSTAGTLSTVDPATGESRLLTDQLPITESDALSAEYQYQMEANLNGWLVFYDLPLLVNAETGEVRQRADLPENLWNGYGHQPQIFLQLKDRLLVDCRYEPYTRTDISDDGTPFTTQTNRAYLGLISIDDFLNGVPNYTEVCRAF